MASKLVLFDKQNFEGESAILTNDVPKLKGMHVNKDVASLIVVSGVWTLCGEENYGGDKYVVTLSGGPAQDGCYPSYNDWAPGGGGKKIQSVDCQSEPPPGSVTVTGYLSDQGVECQGFLADSGAFYTLVNREPYPRQGHLQVIGFPQEASTCQQGTTLSVWQITQIP